MQQAGHLTAFTRLLVLILLWWSVAGCTGRVPVTPTVTAPTAAPAALDPAVVNQQLGRGVNLGNALEANYEGEWGMTLDESYFRLIAEAGFTSVRIPIRWSAHAATEAPYTIEPEFLARVDWAIEQALANDLFVIINMHHYEEIMQEPAAHEARFIGIWEQLAAHYQDQPAQLLFELLNEPNTNLLALRWNRLLAAAITTIRATNPTRILVVGPTGWNNLNDLANLELPDDQQLIVTFHCYEPFRFTHQGAEWVQGTEAWLGTTWEGTAQETRQLTALLDKAAAWSEKHGRPLFMGEFGAYSKADMASRARWTAFMARAAEERGFSWAYWEFGSGFGVYDRSKGAWNAELLQALLPE